MKGELTVKEGVVGIEEFARRQILIEYVAEKHFRLGAHGGLEVVAVVFQKIRRRRHGADVVEIQPTPHEMPDESVGLGIRQHALDLRR